MCMDKICLNDLRIILLNSYSPYSKSLVEKEICTFQHLCVCKGSITPFIYDSSNCSSGNTVMTKIVPTVKIGKITQPPSLSQHLMDLQQVLPSFHDNISKYTRILYYHPLDMFQLYSQQIDDITTQLRITQESMHLSALDTTTTTTTTVRQTNKRVLVPPNAKCIIDEDEFTALTFIEEAKIKIIEEEDRFRHLLDVHFLGVDEALGAIKKTGEAVVDSNLQERADQVQATFSTVPTSTLSSQESNLYHLYQSTNGASIYLHPFLMRYLLQIYIMHNFPNTITGMIYELEHVKLTIELKGKYRFLSHLPVYSELSFVEIDITSYLASNEEVLKAYKKEASKRKEARQAKKRKQQVERRQDADRRLAEELVLQERLQELEFSREQNRQQVQRIINEAPPLSLDSKVVARTGEGNINAGQKRCEEEQVADTERGMLQSFAAVTQVSQSVSIVPIVR
jgi:hypothetical protein